MYIFEQFKRQGYVCEDLEHDPDLGTVAKVREMMARNFWMALKLIEDQLRINQERVCQILPDCLRKSKFCPEFVLRSLTDEQKEPRVIDCEDFIQTCQTSAVTTVDKSWVFQCSYET